MSTWIIQNIESILINKVARTPNPMRDYKDITTYNRITTKQWLYKFLTDITDRYERVGRHRKTGPSSLIKNTRRNRIGTNDENETQSTSMSLRDHCSESTGKQWNPPSQGEKPKFYCIHCKMDKHTKEQRFKNHEISKMLASQRTQTEEMVMVRMETVA